MIEAKDRIDMPAMEPSQSEMEELVDIEGYAPKALERWC